MEKEISEESERMLGKGTPRHLASAALIISSSLAQLTEEAPEGTEVVLGVDPNMDPNTAGAIEEPDVVAIMTAMGTKKLADTLNKATILKEDIELEEEAVGAMAEVT